MFREVSTFESIRNRIIPRSIRYLTPFILYFLVISALVLVGTVLNYKSNAPTQSVSVMTEYKSTIPSIPHPNYPVKSNSSRAETMKPPKKVFVLKTNSTPKIEPNIKKESDGRDIVAFILFTMVIFIVVVAKCLISETYRLGHSDTHTTVQRLLFNRRSLSPHDAALLQIALTQGDFSANDYDLLQQLDEDAEQQMHSGCSDHEINRFPVHEYKENSSNNSNNSNINSSCKDTLSTRKESKKCSVCLGPFDKGDQLRTLPCLHQFHKDCIDPWLRTKSICPICKFSISF